MQSLVSELRSAFPSLSRELNGQPVLYLDGPAGSQVPQTVVDAISDYYLHHNANCGGAFATSQETDQILAAAHQAAADWFGTAEPAECVFGANITTLTFAFSRALAKTWQPGNRIVVTELDHDANITPWRLAAADAGVDIACAKVNTENATLDLEDALKKITAGTRLVAVTAASNSVGSTTPIAEIVSAAHAVGAEVYVDAVHWAPHRLIDVVEWDVDYCVCSAYKFFGPHVGMLWGRLDRLEALSAYKLRPAPAHSPGKWMTGTQNFAALAGATAAVDYIASIGQRSAGQSSLSRRAALKAAFREIQSYEMQLVSQLIQGLSEISGVHTQGIVRSDQMGARVPTVAVVIDGKNSKTVTALLAQQGIYAWHGNYYAVDVCQALGHAEHGMTRLGILHTNTPSEIERTIEAIRTIASGA